LENHTTEYSSESWDKIQSRLKQQKTKPRNYPWLWLSMATIVIVGALFLLQSTDRVNGSADVIEINSSESVAFNDVTNEKSIVIDQKDDADLHFKCYFKKPIEEK